MIQYGDLNINVYTYNILLLLAEWNTEDWMDKPSTFHMREYYFIKSQSYYPDIPMYMEAFFRVFT